MNPPTAATQTANAPRATFAGVYWFPLAAFHAALILPWSVLGQLGLVWAPPGLRYSLGHAHEMLFGFALAVVAGYLLGPREKPVLVTLLALWLGARLSFLAWPGSVTTALCNAAFVIALMAQVMPTYLRTARKWRNRSIAVILLGLLLASVLFHGFSLTHRAGLAYPVVLQALLLLSALMFFMGGRMLAPALAGHLQTQSRHLKDRVQPRIEGAVLILLALVLIANSLPFAAARTLTAILLLACATLTAVRTLRWRIWHCIDRADLLALLSGYLWLIAGWALLGVALLRNWALTPMLHAISVGALGTLTLSVMTRLRMHRVLKDPNARPGWYALTLLIAAAALLRMSAANPASLVAAAACWSLAYAGLFALLLYLARCEQRGVMKDVKRKVKPAPGRVRSRSD